MTIMTIDFHPLIPLLSEITRTLELQKVDTIKIITGGLSDSINTPLMTLALTCKWSGTS